MERNGKLIKAARMIMRAWLNYRMSQRYIVILDTHKIKLLGQKMTKLAKNRQDLIEDINDIRNDIHIAEQVITKCVNY